MLRRQASAKRFKLHRISSYSECTRDWWLHIPAEFLNWCLRSAPFYHRRLSGWVVKFPCIATNQIKSPKWFLSQIDRLPVCFNPHMLAETSHMCFFPQQAVAGNTHIWRKHITSQLFINVSYNICGNKIKVLNGINHSYPLFPWFSDEKKHRNLLLQLFLRDSLLLIAIGRIPGVQISGKPMVCL